MCCGCQPCDSPRVLPPQNAFKHYMRTRDYCTTGRHVIHMCLQGGWLHGWLRGCSRSFSWVSAWLLLHHWAAICYQRWLCFIASIAQCPVHVPESHGGNMPPPTAAVVKCSIELGNYIHLSNYVQKAETTPEAQVVAAHLGCAGAIAAHALLVCGQTSQPALTTPEAQVRCRLWCATCGGNQPSRVWLCIDSKPPVLRDPAGNSA